MKSLLRVLNDRASAKLTITDYNTDQLTKELKYGVVIQ
jgi:hypothetical protein